MCLCVFLSVLLSKGLKDGSKFMEYPGREHRQGDEDLFIRKILRGEEIFSLRKMGAKAFSEKNRGTFLLQI